MAGSGLNEGLSEFHKHALLDAEVPLFNVRDRHAYRQEAADRPCIGIPRLLPPALAFGRDEFHYKPEDLSNFPIPSQRIYQPPPPDADTPPGKYTPQSKTWELVRTDQYKLGFVMASNWSVTERDEEVQRMRNLISSRTVAPVLDERGEHYVVRPIAGMVAMQAGVSVVQFMNGDPDEPMTVGAYHTLDSIQSQHPHFYPRFSLLCTQLAILSWGNKQKNIPRVCYLDGLKSNDRSTARNDLNSRDGSYSLGGTVMKGEGQGVSLPASQANGVQAQTQIGAILVILNELYDLLMMISLSKAEYEITNFHSKANNVYTSGGLKGSFTSLQLNVSSIGVSLEEGLGFQGTFHCDDQDCITRWTAFILLLNL
ncbi:hypothetical protein EST38_g14692, partial [Candolleomyces aberdarensis]